MPLDLIAPPTGYPITLSEVRLQTKTTGLTADDTLIQDIIIPAAVDRAQTATDRQFLLATWALLLDEFPSGGEIDIPKAPLVGASVIVTYRDASDGAQTWAGSNYTVTAPRGPHCARGRLRLASNVAWPQTYARQNAVTVTFQAGYGTEDDVPRLLKAGMLMDAASLYRNRENVLTGTQATAIEVPRGAASIYRSFKSRARA